MGVHEVRPTVTRARGHRRGLSQPLWRSVQHARDAPPFCVIVGLIMGGRLAVIVGGVLVVFSSLDMVLCSLLRHIRILRSIVPRCHSKAYS